MLAKPNGYYDAEKLAVLSRVLRRHSERRFILMVRLSVTRKPSISAHAWATSS